MWGRDGLFKMVMTGAGGDFWVLVPLLDIHVLIPVVAASPGEGDPSYYLSITCDVQKLLGLTVQRGLLFNYGYTSNMQAGKN